MRDASRGAALVLSGIVKDFGATRALDGAALQLGRGSVHALLGENGAGKTTLMRIAYGLLRPDAGGIRMADAAGALREVRLRTPADAIRAGIGMVHQHFTLVPAMTVAENVALGGHGLFHRRAAARHVRDCAAALGITVNPDDRARDLPVAAQQKVEILKALARDARILILDEPTAVLAPAEADELLAHVRSLADRGRTVVLITHKLREALSVADHVTVLRRGRTVLAARAADVTEQTLAQAMLGEAPSSAVEHHAGSTASGDIVIFADGISVADSEGRPRIIDASLRLRRGEILGVAAIDGSGHSYLLRALAGRLSVNAGTLSLPDVVGFVPEDRHRDALVEEFSLVQNVALAGAGRRRGRARWKNWRRTTAALLRDFDVRASSPAAAAAALSGGNQQKLVLARELRDVPAVLVAENPTRGLDVRASAAVHARLRAAAAGDMGVVVYSSDVDEVLALATRMIVVHAGRVRDASLDRAVVGRLMLGLP
ncbi:MAG TPA: ATP-binding cassette domain-containing protein [Gemmatimonadaceae bacterium]|nr:ATP-binding cassette domain-containing protein [Gemmatimonadaceae bacterium]